MRRPVPSLGDGLAGYLSKPGAVRISDKDDVENGMSGEDIQGRVEALIGGAVTGPMRTEYAREVLAERMPVEAGPEPAL